jgi:hypothetical protein
MVVEEVRFHIRYGMVSKDTRIRTGTGPSVEVKATGWLPGGEAVTRSRNQMVGVGCPPHLCNEKSGMDGGWVISGWMLDVGCCENNSCSNRCGSWRSFAS